MFNAGNRLKMVAVCAAVTLALVLAGVPQVHNAVLQSTEAAYRAAAESLQAAGVGAAGAVGIADASGAGEVVIAGASAADTVRIAGAGGTDDVAISGASAAGTVQAAGASGTDDGEPAGVNTAGGERSIDVIASAAGDSGESDPAGSSAAGDDSDADVENSDSDSNTPETRELSLEEALQLAQENNPGFKKLELYKEYAKIEADQASSQAEKIDFNKTTTDIFGNEVSVFSPNLQNAQAKYVNEKAKAAAELVAQKNYETSKKLLELQITQKYYKVLETADMLEVKEAALKRAEQQLKNAEAAYKVGTAAKTELLAAEAGVAGARAALTTARNDYEVAVIELNKAVGLDLNTPLELTTDVEIEPLGEVDLEAVTEKALKERFDIIAAGKTKEVKDENYRVCVAYTAKNTYVSRLAKIDADKAAIDLAKTEKDVQSELLSCYLNVRAAEEALEALEGSVKVREESMRLTELRYDVGLATTLNVLEASEQLMEAQVSYVQAVHRYNLAKLTFETAKVFPVSTFSQ